VALCLPLPTTAAASFQFVSKWGTPGSGNGQFTSPYGIAVSSCGTVWVADRGNDRVQEFTSAGTFLNDDDGYSSPTGIAADPFGTLYFIKTNAHLIVRNDCPLPFLTTFVDGTPTGTGSGKLSFPEGVGADRFGNVYVADTFNNRVQKFYFIGGTFLDRWGANGGDGTSGGGDGEFTLPRGVAVDASGNVYVTDSDNSRVQKLSPTGAFLDKWGSSGSGDGQFQTPVGIAIDAAGNILVADRENDRVQKFSPSGEFLAKFGGFGSADGQFKQPQGIALDADGIIYVTDKGNDRVQRFREVPTLTLSGRQRQRAARQGGVTVGVACPTEPCEISAVGTVPLPGGRVLRLRAAGAELATGGTATLKLGLARKALRAVRRALRRGRKLRASLTVTARDGDGNETVADRTVRLRR
jgi:DNA-binding beta-propeller fold protein YncE